MIKKNLLFLFSVVIFFGFQNNVSAVSCKDLNTKGKILKFLKKSNQSSPLLQKNISVTLHMDACEGKECKSKRKRATKKETLHIIKLEKRRRPQEQ